jgi:hypothetical protein
MGSLGTTRHYVIARWAGGGTVTAVNAHKQAARLPKGVADRPGRCYELAGQEVSGSGGTLVHGTIHHVLVDNMWPAPSGPR